MALLFQRLGHRGEALGDGTGRAGRGAGWVQAKRIGPDSDQAVPDFWPAQVFEVDTEGLAVGKLGVVLPLPGKVGIDLQHMADVADQDERWPPMIDRQRTGVAFGLAAGVAHQHIPASIGGSGARAVGLRGGKQARPKGRGLRMALQAGLLGFEDETAALVQVDAAGCGGPIRQEVLYRSFENVVVVPGRGTGWLWHGKTERLAELVQEHDVVGAFLAAFTPLPASDEGLDRLAGPVLDLAHRPKVRQKG